MSTTTTLAGGCLCGALRYNLIFPMASPPNCLHCHCGMCKKSTGAYFETYVTTPYAQLHWTTDRRPKQFQSSANVKRGFCPNCGSPLTFEAIDDPKISVIVGSLDDVDSVKAMSHIYFESVARVAKEVDRDLPKYRGGEW
ncbi:Mss4-like protein [Jimgerdemannia flammicorona]|uniref:Mss4-like protein n=1 Tax=Jimgerdemannia flammicorona TaxID=994334 RepID=A0A433Q670_9FUNG|nr:Mss4-like protein [Jimgerdemannia flammicorona]